MTEGFLFTQERRVQVRGRRRRGVFMLPSVDRMRDGGVGSAIEVREGFPCDLLRVRQVGNIYGHPGWTGGKTHI